MTARGLSAALITELTNNRAFPLHFVSIAFVSGTLRLHTSIGTYNWDDGGGAADWLGVGDLGGIGGIEESNDLSINNIQLILSPINTSIKTEALDNNDYYMADVFIYLGAVNTAGALVADPDVFWTGFLDDLSMSAGNRNGDSIVATCISETSRLKNTRALKFINAHQQARYSGDLAFEFMDQMEGARPAWRGGQLTPNFGGASSPGPSPAGPSGREL